LLNTQYLVSVLAELDTTYSKTNLGLKMKTSLIVLSLVAFSSYAFSEEFTHRSFLETTMGAEIPVKPMPSDLDSEDTLSDLGQLSANVLGKLYTYVQNIEYVEDEATVYAVYGSMNCVMRYQSENEQWKLKKLQCE